MKRIPIAIIALCLALLACTAPAAQLSENIEPLTATPEISISPTAERVEIVTPATDVYLRACPSLSCRPLDWAWAGEPVMAVCDGEWCRVTDTELYFCLPAALLEGGCKNEHNQ